MATAKQVEVSKVVNYDVMMKLHEVKSLRERLKIVYGGVVVFFFHGAIAIRFRASW